MLTQRSRLISLFVYRRRWQEFRQAAALRDATYFRPHSRTCTLTSSSGGCYLPPGMAESYGAGAGEGVEGRGCELRGFPEDRLLGHAPSCRQQHGLLGDGGGDVICPPDSCHYMHVHHGHGHGGFSATLPHNAMMLPLPDLHDCCYGTGASLPSCQGLGGGSGSNRCVDRVMTLNGGAATLTSRRLQTFPAGRDVTERSSENKMATNAKTSTVISLH